MLCYLFSHPGAREKLQKDLEKEKKTNDELGMYVDTWLIEFNINSL